jgi:Tol biopolymer transport system component
VKRTVAFESSRLLPALPVIPQPKSASYHPKMLNGLRSAFCSGMKASLVLLLLLAALPAQQGRSAPSAVKDWVAEGEVCLKNVRQHTFEGERSGEAYFSPDQKLIAFQSVRGDCPHYQIYIKKLDGTGLWRVTPGQGLTTCAYFRPDGKRMIWASTHLDAATYGPPPPDQGRYAWDKHASFDIFESDLDGANAKRLTTTPGYDAEGSYSPDGARIVFTSSRGDGIARIWTMAADGSDARQVTTATTTYDGGPFFSPDGKRICFRGFRNEKNPRLANLFVIDADGGNETQVTNDLAVNWAPYWHPNGDVLVWCKNLAGHTNYDLFLIRLSDKSKLRLTRHPAADVLPVFSPDGTKLVWTSLRADGRSQLFVADFRLPTEDEWRAGTEEEERRVAEGAARAESRATETAPAASPASLPDSKRLLGDATKLAEGAMEGRRAGTAGAAKAADFVATAFGEARLASAGENGTYRQGFDVLVDVTAGEKNALELRPNQGKSLNFGPPDLVPLAFSAGRDGATAKAEGPLVFRGYGIAAPGAWDDYAEASDVKGKVVLLFLRGLPEGLPKGDNPHANPRAFADTYDKAKAAKDRGAAGVLFVADSKQRTEGGAESLRPEGPTADLGIPVARISRAAIGRLVPLGALEEAVKGEEPGEGIDFETHRAVLDTSVNVVRGRTDNLLGIVKGREKPDEFVILSAHYDHLGYGGPNSLAQGGPAIHHGADDNASGTAGILEIARRLAASPPRRSVLVAAWTGEEDGLLGSAHWARRPTVDLANVVGVVNLDMIGRLGDDGVAIDGVASADEFPALIKQANEAIGLKLGLTAGAMGGRSDHATFLLRGIPALHLFTGAHADYHKPSDTADRLNAEGMAKVSQLAETLVRALADRDGRLAYVKPKAAAQQGTPKSSGAWLGTIPSYGEDSGGVLLSGVSAGSPAEAAGFKAKDRLVKLNGVPIDNIHDFTNALSSCHPGQEVEVVMKRGEETITKRLTLGRR